MSYSHPIAAPKTVIKGKKKPLKTKKKQLPRNKLAPRVTQGNFNQFY